MKIKQFDIWLADLNPRRGTEPGKTRPVVIVQTDLLNETHLSTIICPVTTNVNKEIDLLRVHMLHLVFQTYFLPKKKSYNFRIKTPERNKIITTTHTLTPISSFIICNFLIERRNKDKTKPLQFLKGLA